MKKFLFFSFILSLVFSSCSIPISPDRQRETNTGNSQINTLTPTSTNPSTNSGGFNSGSNLACPNIETGFKSLDHALLVPIQQGMRFDVFEALCGNQGEQDMTHRLEYAQNFFHSVIISHKDGTMSVLPIFLSNNTRFTKSIVSSEFKFHIIGISPKSTKDKILVDILRVEDDGKATTLVGTIEPYSMDENFEVYPEGIAYIGRQFGELHLFTFADKKDTLVGKDVVEFVAYHSDGGSKVFEEGWNLFYYPYPAGVGITSEDDTKFQPKWVDVKFYTYKNGESRNRLTLSGQTRLEGGMGDSTIVLNSQFAVGRDRDTRQFLYFGPHQIQ